MTDTSTKKSDNILREICKKNTIKTCYVREIFNFSCEPQKTAKTVFSAELTLIINNSVQESSIALIFSAHIQNPCIYNCRKSQQKQNEEKVKIFISLSSNRSKSPILLLCRQDTSLGSNYTIVILSAHTDYFDG